MTRGTGLACESPGTGLVYGSGKTYANTPDKIAAIMAKYQNGVKKEQIENWINGL